MAVTTKWFLRGVEGQFGSTAARRVDWPADTVKVMLLDNTFTANQDTMDFVDDVSADEVTGTGYTAGGKSLANKAVTRDDATNTIALDADDLQWTGATLNGANAPRYAVIYKDTGTPTTSPVLGWIDFGQDMPVTSGTFEINWPATGVLKAVAA